MGTDQKKSLEEISKGTLIIFVGMMLGDVTRYNKSNCIPRTLGPELYGVFSLGIAIISIVAAFSTFGLIGSLPRFIPFYLEKQNKNAVRSILRFSLKFVLLTSFLAGILLIIFSVNISSFFKKEALIPILIVFGITLPILIIPNILESIIRGFKGSKYKIYIFELGLRIVTLISFIPFIFLGDLFFGFLTSYVLGYLFVVVVALIIIQKKLFPFLLKKFEPVNIKKELLIFSFPLALSSLSYLFISKTDTVIVGYFLSLI